MILAVVISFFAGAFAGMVLTCIMVAIKETDDEQK